MLGKAGSPGRCNCFTCSGDPAGRPTTLAVPLPGFDYFGDGVLQARVLLSPRRPSENERSLVPMNSASMPGVAAISSMLLHGARLFDDGDHGDVLVGASRCSRSGSGQAKARERLRPIRVGRAADSGRQRRPVPPVRACW